MGFLADDIRAQLAPLYGAGLTNTDLLLAFWKAEGFGGWPGGDAEFAFYGAAGAVGSTLVDRRADFWGRVGP